MEKTKILKFKGDNIYLRVYQYQDNGRIAILSYTMDGEDYTDITVNLPDVYIYSKTTVFINSFVTSCGLEKILQKEGIIKEILENVQYNFGTYTKVSIDIEKLKEYDSEGVEKLVQEGYFI